MGVDSREGSYHERSLLGDDIEVVVAQFDLIAHLADDLSVLIDAKDAVQQFGVVRHVDQLPHTGDVRSRSGSEDSSQ